MADKVRATGVQTAAVEIAFEAETSAGTIPARAIEERWWNVTAYTDDLFIAELLRNLRAEDNVVQDQLGILQGANALLDRGAADFFGIRDDGTGFLNLDVQRGSTH